ncbi:uncharacterized protein LOC125027523 [Penaeus chinensis]|uniref:uncharacterized protein LOC125027523 n=1 Tax=Penaeus chinensis TaxID=139456 RepID=UPI001FB6309D|nr:uncharacterized protein LOC125027523 [Penaeus chinensis]
MLNRVASARGIPLLWLTVGLTVLRQVNSGVLNTTHRDDRFIFTVIQFANTLCGTGLNSGTCYTSTQCDKYGGTEIGTCARGYGTCCGVSLTGCGGDIRINNTWVYSLDYPNTYNDDLVCSYRVYFDDTPGKICQIRYDFAAHDLVAPNIDGVCANDRLVFREDTKSTYFCGKAPENYHWYVDTAGTVSPHTFTIITDTSNYFRRYAMKVSFIRCKERVPSRCGQYYTGLSGTINSYNYNNGYYLAGLDYGICFRKESGYCTYTLRKTSNNQYIDDSDMLRLPVGGGIELVPNPSLAGSSFFCGVTVVKMAAMYYTPPLCYYPEAITSAQTQGPFFVNVYTAIDTVDNVNPLVRTPPQAGFEFDWETNQCT